MATLAKIAYHLCSNEAAASDDYDLHSLIRFRWLLRGFGVPMRYLHETCAAARFSSTSWRGFLPVMMNACAGNLICPLMKYLCAASAAACFMVGSCAGVRPAIVLRKLSDISVRNCQNCSNEIFSSI